MVLSWLRAYASTRASRPGAGVLGEFSGGPRASSAPGQAIATTVPRTYTELRGRTGTMTVSFRASVSVALAVLGLVPTLALAPAAAAAGPHISIAGVSLKEDSLQALFPVTLTGPHSDLSVRYATRDGSAIANKDYYPTS